MRVLRYINISFFAQVELRSPKLAVSSILSGECISNRGYKVKNSSFPLIVMIWYAKIILTS